MVEAQCERLRMLYRDCARPPPPPLQTDRRQVLLAHVFFNDFLSQQKAYKGNRRSIILVLLQEIFSQRKLEQNVCMTTFRIVTPSFSYSFSCLTEPFLIFLITYAG